MMVFRLVPVKTNIDFLHVWKLCFLVSGLLLLLTLAGLFTKGLNYGIDFSGGTLIQVQTTSTPDVSDVRAALTHAGFTGIVIQEYGAPNEFLIRIPGQSDADTISSQVLEAVDTVGTATELRRVEFVGPQIGQELRQKGILAILFSMIAILAYVSMRFEFRYGVGSIVALAHDVVLTVGAFVLLQKEVSLPVLAALLTVIGYSLNDTIVVFDRVRENRRKYRKKRLFDLLNLSLNETLTRTLMTGVTTLVVLLALFFFGGEVIHDFAFTLMFGVIVGTYSSVYIAAPVVLALDKYYKVHPPQKQKEAA